MCVCVNSCRVRKNLSTFHLNRSSGQFGQKTA